MPFTLPNALTVSRIAAAPLLIGLFYLPAPAGPWAVLGLFLAAALTDLADGWLARALDQRSALGRALDPIADKLLVATALVMLAAFDQAPAAAVALLIARETLIAGLREALAGRRVLPVSRLAKAKTAAQMMAVVLLLLARAWPGPAPHGAPLAVAGVAVLWLAVALGWASAGGYICAAWPALVSRRDG